MIDVGNDLDDLDWISILAALQPRLQALGGTFINDTSGNTILFVEDRFNDNPYSGWWLLQIE
jgi:hypothetical protein